MYRQYEDPRELTRQLEELEAKFAEPGYEMDEFDWERVQNLKERINFAWQDEEYEEDLAREYAYYEVMEGIY